MAAMGRAMEQGMVLTMSIWDDHAANMLWLDSDYPTDMDPSKPGVARGSCSTSSGKPNEVESQHAGASVTWSNIKYGEIGSTFPGPSPGPSPSPPPSGCPGGDLQACMGLCPADPTAFKACVQVCEQRCHGDTVVV